MPQDGAMQPTQNDTVATQTVTVTYLATEGGRITDASIQQVPVGGYTEKVKAVARAFKNCPNLKLILDPNVVIYN